MFFGFVGNLRSSYDRRFSFFLKIERSEGEKKYRPEHEKNDGFGKAAEKIKNGRENEMYEEKKDVHRLEVNSKRRNERERDRGEQYERRPAPHLFQRKSQEGNGGQRENETVGNRVSGKKFGNRTEYGKEDHVREGRVCEKISERTA